MAKMGKEEHIYRCNQWQRSVEGNNLGKIVDITLKIIAKQGGKE